MSYIYGHSVDGGIFQALCGFVFSMCYSIDTTHGHACNRQRICWSVDAGFVLALPLRHRDLELDSVGVSNSMKAHVAILLTWPWLGGLLRDKIPVQEL